MILSNKNVFLKHFYFIESNQPSKTLKTLMLISFIINSLKLNVIQNKETMTLLLFNYIETNQMKCYSLNVDKSPSYPLTCANASLSDRCIEREQNTKNQTSHYVKYGAGEIAKSIFRCRRQYL